MLIAVDLQAALNHADARRIVFGGDDALLAAERRKEVHPHAQHRDRHNDVAVGVDVGIAAEARGEHRDEKAGQRRRHGIDDAVDGDDFGAFLGVRGDDRLQLAVGVGEHGRNHCNRHRNEKGQIQLLRVRQGRDGQKDIDRRQYRNGNAHHRDIRAETPPARAGIVHNAAADYRKKDVEDRINHRHILDVHGRYADGRADKRVADRQAEIPGQRRDELLAHTAEAEIQNLLIRDLIFPARGLPMAGYVLDDVDGKRFAFFEDVQGTYLQPYALLIS